MAKNIQPLLFNSTFCQPMKHTKENNSQYYKEPSILSK